MSCFQVRMKLVFLSWGFPPTFFLTLEVWGVDSEDRTRVGRLPLASATIEPSLIRKEDEAC
jgi:hypothetical protein